MESWVIVIIVVVILLALAGGWLRRLSVKHQGDEATLEGPPSSQLDSENSTFTDSVVKGRGGSRMRFKKTRTKGSRFDIR